MSLVDEYTETRTKLGMTRADVAREIGGNKTIVSRFSRLGRASRETEAKIAAWIGKASKRETVWLGEWREIPGFEGLYEVSDLGEVRSMDRLVTRANGNVMKMTSQKTRLNTSGQGNHKTARLTRDGMEKPYYVHRLVLETFVGPAPEGTEGCHYDGNPSNNRLDNLRWDTRAGNHADAVRHGTAYPVWLKLWKSDGAS